MELFLMRLAEAESPAHEQGNSPLVQNSIRDALQSIEDYGISFLSRTGTTSSRRPGQAASNQPRRI